MCDIGFDRIFDTHAHTNRRSNADFEWHISWYFSFNNFKTGLNMQKVHSEFVYRLIFLEIFSKFDYYCSWEYGEWESEIEIERDFILCNPIIETIRWFVRLSYFHLNCCPINGRTIFLLLLLFQIQKLLFRILNYWEKQMKIHRIEFILLVWKFNQ